MYIRVTNPKFLELGDSGRPAAGYLVWTLVAGSVSTLATTYSNREMTSAHENPIVLDARGEAHIFVNTSLKLVYTAPDGDLSSPIWTEDYAVEQQSTVSDKGAGVFTDNTYAVDIVPAYDSIPDGFSLVMIPDTSCLGTLVIPVGTTRPTVFTGTGINDGAFTGRYLGSTAGAVFAATIDACYVEEPTTAPTATVSATVGATPPTAGVHLVAITYVTAEGETLIGPTGSVTADGTHKIDLADIPTGPADKGITARRIYMTEAAGADFYYVDEIADVVTTTYKIDLTDVTLVGNDAAPVANDTGDGSGADTFSWQVDAGAATAGVPIGNSGPQTLQDGLFLEFSSKTGHTLGDVWTVEVMTPAKLNFCGLGADLIYKSEGGALVVLDADDIIADYPAHLDYSLAESCWILINPSLPVLESLIPLRRRKEITADYTVDPDEDQGLELNVTVSGVTVTLSDCIDAVSHFFYVRNGSDGLITIDAGTYTIKGPDTTTMLLGPGIAAQLATNGVDWHILTTSESVPAGIISMYVGATAPVGYLLCNGDSYVRADYVNLFAVIGVAFGVGDDDPNTFNVPDMQNRFPKGAGTLGEIGGSADADHSHTAILTDSPGSTLGEGIESVTLNTTPGGWQSTVAAIATIGLTGSAGYAPPSQSVNFIIKY